MVKWQKRKIGKLLYITLYTLRSILQSFLTDQHFTSVVITVVISGGRHQDPDVPGRGGGGGHGRGQGESIDIT